MAYPLRADRYMWYPRGLFAARSFSGELARAGNSRNRPEMDRRICAIPAQCPLATRAKRPSLRRVKSALVSALLFCLWATGAFVVCCTNLHDVVIDGRIYFADTDCYSRMTRVRMIDAHPGLIVRHQDFENYPQGTDTHATAPMDYLIIAVKWLVIGALHVVDPHHTSVLETQTLDVAGALVSPLLGALGCGFLALFARRHLSALGPGAWAAPFLWAVSPIMAHGSILGRPDHQSLQMLLVVVALAAECRLAAGPSRGWGIASGASWALGLWVSLYEPTVLFVAVLALWLWLKPRALIARERWPGWIVFALILLAALAIEGWPVELPDPKMEPFLANWGATIGELGHLSLFRPALYRWLGAACLASPVLLFLAYRKDRRALPAGLLLALVFALTCWQIRWGYFLAIVYALTLPWQLAVLRRRWVIGLVVAASLWPMLTEWEGRLFPDPEAREEMHQEEKLMREMAESLRGPEKSPFLAPWWISPALAYWSEQPGVAGSSHEAIAGTVDSARFYLAQTPAEAAAILRARKVSRVVSDDPAHILEKCAPILGVTVPEDCMAVRLVEHFRSPAPYLIPVFSNNFFKVFAVDQARLGP
jgi:hypothetical protein